MPEVLSLVELRSRYPNEWVLIADPETDATLTVQSGHVLAHSRDRDEVYRQAVALRPERFAVLYLGSIPEGTAVVL